MANLLDLLQQGVLYMSFKSELRVVTSPKKNGMIYQRLYSEVNDIETMLYAQVIDTSNKQVFQALIDLGWTPPKDFKPDTTFDTSLDIVEGTEKKGGVNKKPTSDPLSSPIGQGGKCIIE